MCIRSQFHHLGQQIDGFLKIVHSIPCLAGYLDKLDTPPKRLGNNTLTCEVAEILGSISVETPTPSNSSTWYANPFPV